MSASDTNASGSNRPTKLIDDYSISDFEQLPSCNEIKNFKEFNSLVILPTNLTHDSGYRCLDYVAVKENVPICRLAGTSDVLHVDGILGQGNKLLREKDKQKEIPIAWTIDCLNKSGLLRLFSKTKLIVGMNSSSFEIIAKR